MNELATAAAALRTTDPRYPWVQPTEDEAEVADILDELGALHLQSGSRCKGCAEYWPCAGFVHGHQFAAQWLGRAATRVLSRYYPQPAPEPTPVKCCPELLCEHVSRTKRQGRAA